MIEDGLQNQYEDSIFSTQYDVAAGLDVDANLDYNALLASISNIAYQD